MPFSSTVGKIDDERMRLNLISGTAGRCKCFAMRREAAIRDREICGLRARRRWLGKVPNGQDHASEDKQSLGERNGGRPEPEPS
jgi:hypothetical protein